VYLARMYLHMTIPLQLWTLAETNPIEPWLADPQRQRL